MYSKYRLPKGLRKDMKSIQPEINLNENVNTNGNTNNVNVSENKPSSVAPINNNLGKGLDKTNKETTVLVKNGKARKFINFQI